MLALKEQTLCFILLLLSVSLKTTTGFVVTKNAVILRTHSERQQSSPSRLQFSTSANTITTEADATFVLNKAREFAYSDDASSSHQAKAFLGKILHIQSHCAAGTLAGKDICSLEGDIVQVVAQLRYKADASASEIALDESRNGHSNLSFN